MTVLLFIVGLVLLISGAEILVRSASWLAAAIGVPPLVIGLTVVAFGTSAPEMAVSAQSALQGNASIAVGNVVGSNLFNILCILGLSATIIPLAVSRQLIRIDVPVMIALTGVVYWLIWDNELSQVEGILLFLGLCLYSFLQIRLGRKHFLPEAEPGSLDMHPTFGQWAWAIVLFILGMVMLVGGSRLMVDSAVVIATWLGLSQTIIGLTIVAGGTSLPEAVTSLMAAIKGERDIAVGNVVGSNVFNLLGVLGLCGMLSPAGVPIASSIVNFDFPIMLAATVVCFPIFFTDGRIYRWEGLLLFGYFIAYTIYLILRSTQHEALERFNNAMLYFVVPLSLLALGLSFWIALRAQRHKRRSANAPSDATKS